jgi:hypothetical protein
MTPLERATEAYFANMTPEESKAERELEDAIAGAPEGLTWTATNSVSDSQPILGPNSLVCGTYDLRRPK